MDQSPGRRVVLHVGLHKTGSSSIQETLYRLPPLGPVRYLHTGNPNSSLVVQTAFRDDPGLAEQHQLVGSTPAEIADMRERVLRTLGERLEEPVDTFILSAESLPLLSVNELRRLQTFLLAHVDRVEIVGYVREARSFIDSYFGQRVKVGLMRTFDLESVYPAYRWRLEKFDDVFGRENVHLSAFDPARFDQGSVVLDFCRRFGLRLEPTQIVFANETLSLHALQLLYTYRRFGPPMPIGRQARDTNRRLIDAVREVSGPKPAFARALVDPILDRHRDDLKWMAGRLGESVVSLAPDPLDAVGTEDDLLDSPQAARHWLADRIGEPTDTLDTAGPEAIARAMQSLWVQVSRVG